VIKVLQENLVVSDSDVSLLDIASNAEEACRIIVEKSKGVYV
jgi:hypothetical protein